MNEQNHKYPLSEHAAEELHAASGRSYQSITLEAAVAGELSGEDVNISADALRAQAGIARQGGFVQLAENLLRAAELVAVPNAEVLAMYELLRPGRATFEQLTALATRLEHEYRAPVCAAFVREAAEVYRRRGLLIRE
jgi:propanediol dehydratase small subunit